ncbi:hypothetical protein AD998_09200 [bacterium 336/3]|nr:hypothetical protein AD998_09200 [bacterium 336/3]
MYREKYCQQRAIQMYASGQTKTEVIEMLKEENAKEEELEALADTFYKDYQFLQKQRHKQRKQDAEQNMIVGGVLLGVGILLSLILSEEGSYNIWFTGLIIGGAIALGRGIILKNNTD